MTLDFLTAIATEHPDPAAGKILVGDPEDWSPENLTSNALNCTRGAAVFAVAHLLFDDPQRLEALGAAMERIVADPHPAVRVAAFRCCLAVLEAAPERAIAWAVQAAEGHDALPATSDFDRFLLFACRRHPDAMEPTLRRMLDSPRADVVRVAAGHAVGLYLEHGRMEKEARGCVNGATPQRVGAAEVAAALAGNRECGPTARSILLKLVNDEEAAVLKRCGQAFHNTSLELFAGDLDFLDAYASSRAFLRHRFMLMHSLNGHPGSLVPFASCILRRCQSLSTVASVRDAPSSMTFGDGRYYLPGILLRLYEQAQEKQVRELCLDACVGGW